MENVEEGKWFDFRIDGTIGVIGLKIRSYDYQIVTELILKSAVRQKRKKYKIKSFNNPRIFNEYFDYLLEDFRGIIDAEKNNQPLPVNLDNKIALIKSCNYHNLTCDGQDIQTFITRKALKQAGFPDAFGDMSVESVLIKKINKWRKRNG